ncbi:MAG: hypothetical protein JKX76_00625 [Colwellia sp.]|nr:hypothetical protein [Colwellia sp.]
MARIPDVIRKQAISHVAPDAPRAGFGFAALAELAQVGADFVKPAAEEQAKNEGFESVYRDDNGKLQVGEKSALGGEMADIHDAAAFSKYLSQRSIDMSETFTELARNNEFDPDGFRQSADAYIRLLEEDEKLPGALKEDLLANAQTESNRRFNGLFNNATQRTYRESDRNTATHRDMLVDDYVNLYAGGDAEAAEAKLSEIESLSAFRTNAPYISETEAETQAYLRGARGAAQAARLTRILGDTRGATELSDETRAEIDTALKDPDLSPKARQSLYLAVQGRLKGVDAAAFVDTAAADDYGSKVVRVESGGVSTAANPNSSALGGHQFTKGTWLNVVKDLRAQGGAVWATGLQKDQILEMRKDPEASAEAFELFRAQNAAVLQNSGFPVNDTTEYMAHFFGAGGAVSVLSADPAAILSDFLPAKVIEANPFLANMTATDARNWAARKMTMKGSDIARQQVAVDGIEDTEVRAMASNLLNDRYNVRRRLEDAAAVEYEERLTAKDDTLTALEIGQDHELSDSKQASLMQRLRKQRKDQIEVQQTVAALATEGTIWNPYDSKQRNRVDDAYNAILSGEHPSSPAGQVAAGEIALRSGFLPKTSFQAVRGAVAGNDPVALASNLEFFDQVTQRQPGAADMYDGKGGVNAALSDYQFYSQFMGAEEAAAQIIENNSPEATARRKNLTDAAKEAVKGLKTADLIEHLSAKGVSARLGNEAQQAEMMSEYETLFRDAYVATGNSDLAENRALGQMSRIYGPNGVTGHDRLMKYPPQNFYPTSETDPDWMQNQVEQAVSQHVFGDEANSGWGWGARNIRAKNIILLSDETTRREVSAHTAPSYTVLYNHDGELTPVPGRFFFDPTDVQSANQDLSQQRQQDGDTQRSKETEVVNLRLWREHLREQGMTAGQALDEVTQNKAKYQNAPPETE